MTVNSLPRVLVRRLAACLWLTLVACGGNGYGAPRGLEVDRLWDADPAVKARAQEGLLARGAAAVPELCLPETAPVYQRSSAIAVLDRMGPEARAAVPWLLGTLAREPLLRPSAARALSGIGPAVVPEIADALRSSGDPQVRAALSEALGGVRPVSDDAILLMTARLQSDPVEDVRAAAARALGRARVGTPDVIAALEDAVRAEGMHRQFYAAVSLGELGEPGVDALLRLRLSAGESVRAAAASGLESATAEPGRRVSALTELLDDRSPHVRRVAANSLGRMGSAARPALDALRERARRWKEEGDERGAESAAEAVLHLEEGEPEKLRVPPEPPRTPDEHR